MKRRERSSSFIFACVTLYVVASSSCAVESEHAVESTMNDVGSAYYKLDSIEGGKNKNWILYFDDKKQWRQYILLNKETMYEIFYDDVDFGHVYTLNPDSIRFCGSSWFVSRFDSSHVVFLDSKIGKFYFSRFNVRGIYACSRL